MKTGYIDVQLEYLDGYDPSCPYIRCPFAPHAGDIIKTDSGKLYRVRSLTFDAHATQADEPCHVVASVKLVKKH